jgi:hypothetical protein
MFSFIFLLNSFTSYKIKNEITNLMDPTRIKLQDNKSIPNFEHPIDISLMYKEINQCQNIIDRLEKILGSVRDENEKFAQTINSKE